MGVNVRRRKMSTDRDREGSVLRRKGTNPSRKYYQASRPRGSAAAARHLVGVVRGPAEDPECRRDKHDGHDRGNPQGLPRRVPATQQSDDPEHETHAEPPCELGAEVSHLSDSSIEVVSIWVRMVGDE